MSIFSKNELEKKIEKRLGLSLLSSTIISIILIITKPSISIITKDLSATFGVTLLSGTVVLSAPLLYKFAENKSKGEETQDK